MSLLVARPCGNISGDGTDEGTDKGPIEVGDIIGEPTKSNVINNVHVYIDLTSRISAQITSRTTNTRYYLTICRGRCLLCRIS